MKNLIFVVVVGLTLSAIAVGPGSIILTPEQEAKQAHAQDVLNKKVGGFVVKPGTQKGEIFYVNCQTRANKAWIEESVDYFAKETKFKVSLKDGSFDLKTPKVEGQATLFVIDDESLPAILVAPENRWAFVNIAAIAKEQRPAFFEARVKKELTRGFAYLCGAANSQYPRALTRGIVDHRDLDQNPDLRLPVDVMQRFRTYMETLGVTPAVQVTYRKACQEGWAPKPENEFQQKIWDDINTVPTNPIVIKPGDKPAK